MSSGCRVKVFLYILAAVHPALRGSGSLIYSLASTYNDYNEMIIIQPLGFKRNSIDSTLYYYESCMYYQIYTNLWKSFLTIQPLYSILSLKV
jgi:hypothetical protein